MAEDKLNKNQKETAEEIAISIEKNFNWKDENGVDKQYVEDLINDKFYDETIQPILDHVIEILKTKL